MSIHLAQISTPKFFKWLLSSNLYKTSKPHGYEGSMKSNLTVTNGSVERKTNSSLGLKKHLIGILTKDFNQRGNAL